MTDRSRSLSVRLWLWGIALLIGAMVVVGGATRLTQSGLSITEWQPIAGAIPPLTERDWQAEFRNYQRIPQYRELNRDMTLGEFKGIFWWEWAHRLLGRIVGVVVALPLIFFWWRGMIGAALARRLGVIFVLGALQGALGWWMVSSGLAGSGRTSVAPYRLAMHLTLAVLLFAAVVWTARSLRPRRDEVPAAPVVRIGAWAVLAMAFVQLFLGAVTAGLHAGLSFNTWPLMDGTLFPSAAQLFPGQPAWLDLFTNPMTAQFFHRMGAYLLFALALAHAATAWGRGPASRRALAVLAMVTAQATLGILTLVNVVPIPLALCHQFGAIVVIALATADVEALGSASPRVSRVESPVRAMG
ncbi:MAG TPA: COX15/CtaA family protein [Hyphomicrobiales bacterium]|nr:COX15/CtaA family protein [Hyphomicrobiales bacterium]